MGKLIDLKNQRFGFWLVVKKDINNKSGKTQWVCMCDCGTTKLVTSNSLRTGNSTSCGCNHTPNLVNHKFTNFVVLQKESSNGRRLWMCKCKCGRTFVENTHKLRNEITKSCGKCSLKENKYSKWDIKNFSNLLNKLEILQENVKLIQEIQEKTDNAILLSKTTYESLVTLQEVASKLSSISLVS